MSAVPQLPIVRTRADLDALPVGSVLAYIGDEPASPSVACKNSWGEWCFLADPPDRVRRSSDLAPESPGDMALIVLHRPDWYPTDHHHRWPERGHACVVCGESNPTPGDGR